jgi:hypothetical protein
MQYAWQRISRAAPGDAQTAYGEALGHFSTLTAER